MGNTIQYIQYCTVMFNISNPLSTDSAIDVHNDFFVGLYGPNGLTPAHAWKGGLDFEGRGVCCVQAK